ncbi:minor tail protein [Mycobacterium phage DarthPhader]|uniref:Minor tail protein n=1 Tax=Mycobacterium phage DarthPhader TaxID=1912975 RepID=A0A1I9S3X6_9CAUD|nr:minor tail protein [Mycobacterium phage DarthPhader]AOZ61270.1 minor tail protein [Mycobacterium phage DarthPhader]
MSIPTQDSHDPRDPKQHAVWALRNLPMAGGVGAITHPGYLAGWSEHLWKCGFRHVDSLRALADENGNIHVSKLPQQEIKFQPAFRGQRHDMNHAARWVEMDAPDPEPVRIPNIRQLTQQENQAMIQQYREAGMIPDDRPGPAKAAEFTE